MAWLTILVVGILLLLFIVPVTPFQIYSNRSHQEPFRIYDGITECPSLPLIRNGQREEEDIHRRDVLSRIVPYIPPAKDVHS